MRIDVSFPVRRLLWRVLGCLVFGALLTLASAWLPGTFMSTGTPTMISAGGRFSMARSDFGTTVKVYRLSAPGIDALVLFTVGVEPPRQRWIPTGDEPELDGVITPGVSVGWHLARKRAEASDNVWLLIESRGWPARSLWCHQAQSGFAWERVDLVGAFTLPGAHRTLSNRYLPPAFRNTRTLPYLPVWPGLAINLAFWSAAAAPLVFAPVAIRRLRRKRRGACPACGYDLRGLPAGGLCPECGLRGACEVAT